MIPCFNSFLSSRFAAIQPLQLPAFDYTPPKYTGPSREKVLSDRKKHLSPALLTYYQNPLMIVDAKMQYMFDETGRRYLDALAGIVTVSAGHCHPKITQAAIDQMNKIQHSTTIYLTPGIGTFAETLLSKMPDHIDTVYFVNSGSEANDMAVSLARLYTGNHDYITMRNGYHGMSPITMGLTALSTWKQTIPHDHNIKHALCPDLYKGAYTIDEMGSEEQCVDKYLWHLDNLIAHETSGQVAGIEIEPIQGVGGTVDIPGKYMQKAFEKVRAAGGINVVDEVQTGFGRTGTHYWGWEEAGVDPNLVDMIVMAKGIGNGAPLAAVATRREIAETMANRIHFNTFGGNPISMAIGQATLEAIEEDGLQDNCLKVGNYLLKNLEQLKSKHPLIGDVRGKGLMLGVELVKDPVSKEPATAETAAIFESMREFGVLSGKGGYHGNVLRIKPPMCITIEDADVIVESIDKSIQILNL